MSATLIQKTAAIGSRTIGIRWAAAFSHAGLEVQAYDPDPPSWDRYLESEPALRDGLQRILPREGKPGCVAFAATLAEALESVDFVQENSPENLAAKQTLVRELDRLAP